MEIIRDLLAGKGKLARELGARLMPRASDRYYDQQSPPPEATVKMENPRTTLLRLMNLPASRFDAVVLSSDGYYIAQAIGDVGYNHFLGKPAPVHDGPGRDNTLKIWNSLTEDEQAQVRAVAAYPGDGQPIPLADFGVPD